MILLLLYWSVMIIGYLIAFYLRKQDKRFDFGQKTMMAVIYIVCLTMGLRMGANPQVISNLGIIGLEALGVTAVCLFGSILAIFVTRKILGMDRYGNPRGQHQCPKDSGAGGGDGGMDIKNTLIILGMVFAGMIAGAVFLTGSSSEVLDAFDKCSYYALVVLVSVLLFFVGFDLGTAGNIIKTIRQVGMKAFAFAFAAMAGTMAFGVIFCLILGFSLRESAAICIGFGWYSYAPVIIASAGQQYMIASALSFMHNVIRELTGIVFVPLIARKIGYLESVGVPGGCAMDVCLPIIEKSCRADTAVYAFATGLLMCITTSIGTPLIMGV
ncbi:MAG: lysine exporter LysO family protein [Lentihominibacter sp.]